MMDAKEMVKSILWQYSCNKYEETHCATADIERDFVRLIESILRSERDTRQVHEAWMFLQRNKENNKTFLQRIFA